MEISYFGYKPASVMSKAVTVGSFRLEDTNHGSLQTFPLQFPCGRGLVGCKAKHHLVLVYRYMARLAVKFSAWG